MYNFFFTEPRFSLVMIHREDILTVGFFLIMAALTGHQAARLRAQVVTLQNRSIFTRIQLELLESLTSAIDKSEVFQGLNMALCKIVAGSVSNEMIKTLYEQTCLALGRTRLVRDVQKERLEKERELLRSALNRQFIMSSKMLSNIHRSDQR